MIAGQAKNASERAWAVHETLRQAKNASNWVFEPQKKAEMLQKGPENQQ